MAEIDFKCKHCQNNITITLEEQKALLNICFQDLKQPDESDVDFKFRVFKKTKDWFLLDEEMIVKLFQEAKPEDMMQTLANYRNCVKFAFNIEEHISYDTKTFTRVKKRWMYNPRVLRLLNYCLENLHKFNDITELMKCVIQCVEINHPDENWIAYRPDRIKFPNFAIIASKQMDTETWKELLTLPEIQTQLANPGVVNACKSVIELNGSLQKLHYLNKAVPSRCIIA